MQGRCESVDNFISYYRDCASDCCSHCTCRIWDYDADEVVNTFDNHNNLEKGVSKLCLLNELDDSLLLVASSKLPIFTCDPSTFVYNFPVNVALHECLSILNQFLDLIMV